MSCQVAERLYCYSGFCYYQSVLLFLLHTVFSCYGNVMYQYLMIPVNLRYKFVLCFES